MDAKTDDSRAQHRPRLEDDPLVRGLGRYAADAPLTGQTYAYFVRSPHAFADIRSIDTERGQGGARRAGGADRRRHGEAIGNISQHPPLAGRGGQKLIIPIRPALAGKTVRHVGEAVAVVVGRDADGRAGRRRSWSRSTTRSARRWSICARPCATGAPQVWPEAPGNIAVDWPGLAPDPDANAKEVDRIIASAKHVARVSLVHQRILVPRWSRAAPPRATIRPTTAISCAAARRARARCATDLRPSWAFPTQRCGWSPRMSAAPSD